MNQISRFLVSAVLFTIPCSQVVLGQDMLTIDNGKVRVGIERSKGAAITWLSSADHPQNMINVADPGRLIQQSYYAGRSRDRKSEGQHSSWSPWTWNPIQGGGVGKGGEYGEWATVNVFQKSDNQLYSETIPKLWDMKNEDAEATMSQWTKLVDGQPHIVEVRCRIQCTRDPKDAWGPAVMRSQEVPACYFTRQFSRIVSYAGNGEWQNHEQPPGPPWGRVKPKRNAMAVFNIDDIGIGVYSPTATEHWNFGPHAHGSSTDPKAGPCIHLAPISKVPLGPSSTYEYRYWITVGNRQTIQNNFDWLIQNHSAETATHR